MIAAFLIGFGVLTALDGLVIIFIMRRNYKEERKELINMIIFTLAGLLMILAGIILK